jgi:hypothetical protein
MLCHNFLIGKGHTYMCTENHVCFGRVLEYVPEYTVYGHTIPLLVPLVWYSYTCTYLYGIMFYCHNFLIGKGHTHMCTEKMYVHVLRTRYHGTRVPWYSSTMVCHT